MKTRAAFPITTAICVAVVALGIPLQGEVRPQGNAIRKLREKMANMPVPENLQRRTLMIGNREREFFSNILAACKGKPAPVIFALHGGASSSGLAQHLKVDYTKLGEQEGHGHGWPMKKGRDETGTGPKTRDISAPEEFWTCFQSIIPHTATTL